MKFSVIIPAHFAERTLRNCLDSLRSQTYQDFEAIVVDDGSADGTGAIAREFAGKDRRFRYIFQENQGVSAARNRGLGEARGELIAFLDSDDRYDSSYLARFADMVQDYPDCDNFWCGYQIIDAGGNFSGQCLWADETVMSNRSDIMELHTRALDAALWNKVYRKRIIDRHGLRMHEDLSLGEDMLFNFEYLDVSGTMIVMNSQPLYIYTKAENGTLDSKYRGDLKEIYDTLNDAMLSYLKKWNITPEAIKKYYTSVFYMNEKVLYNTYRPECPMSSAEKRGYNNGILRSERFQLALRESECRIHPLYRFAYKIGSWELVMLLDMLAKLKNG